MSPTANRPGPIESPPGGLDTDTDADFAGDPDSTLDRGSPHDASDRHPPAATSAFPVSKTLGPRDVVRLFQCRICSHPLREPVCLPCGKTMCRSCIPETHRRANISYPALPTRLRGFRCPFPDCNKEHAIEDCGVDVVLNKASGHVRDEIERRKCEARDLGVSTWVSMQDPWAAAGITSLREYNDRTRVVQGGKLVATYTLAEGGDLKHDEDSAYDLVSTSSEDGDSEIVTDKALMVQVQDITRVEMDCQVCYALFCDPLTTACGHTYCRSCLHRILDHSRYCPICRRQLAINPLLNHTSCPSNESLTRIIDSFWPDELKARQEAVVAENDANQLDDFDFPLFVCTLAFPRMPTFLHVFEPRYRLMIRRALEGDRTFGMVLPSRSQDPDDPDFLQLGTLLRIVNVQYYPDGRSLIETVGISRFRVLRHGYLDGYTVGKTERVDDVSLQEEEAMEAAEAAPRERPASTTPPVGDDKEEPSDPDEPSESSESAEPSQPSPPTEGLVPITIEDVDSMSTENLLGFASSFVMRMRSQSVPWLTERMLSIYGECPDDAAIFPWWFASMLPVKDDEKYRLLGTSSVRERLKICCVWIIEWEASRW
ncbi:hypothetical protein B0T10DRAFT_403063 [Thelonectria olida]|uniref:Uncharacterized protein n=1 Tax=Thelonectria olida TaxID=1576542 RepID=A0A9P8W588_9HYPO|nr:hypothetical protein B0T10DRAFT_403063 [Thelonectria olida]